jgi:hypothetical protein
LANIDVANICIRIAAKRIAELMDQRLIQFAHNDISWLIDDLITCRYPCITDPAWNDMPEAVKHSGVDINGDAVPADPAA